MRLIGQRPVTDLADALARASIERKHLSLELVELRVCPDHSCGHNAIGISSNQNVTEEISSLVILTTSAHPNEELE